MTLRSISSLALYLIVRGWGKEGGGWMSGEGGRERGAYAISPFLLNCVLSQFRAECIRGAYNSDTTGRNSQADSAVSGTGKTPSTMMTDRGADC